MNLRNASSEFGIKLRVRLDPVVYRYTADFLCCFLCAAAGVCRGGGKSVGQWPGAEAVGEPAAGCDGAGCS